MSSTPMLIPDDKDWTWVLNDLCPECGNDVRHFPKDQVGALLRESIADWLHVLDGDEHELRTRPRPDKWSPLEYAAHVRDVFELYDQRLETMLDQDGPHYPNWDQDAAAVDNNYAASEPQEVADDLRRHGHRLAERFDGLDGQEWERTGYRSDGAAFTVETFARYFLHDPLHHLWDVRIP